MKTNMKKVLVAGIALCAAIVFTGCQGAKYDEAQSLFGEGKYEEAKEAFAELEDYEDSADMVKECDYQMATLLLEEGNLEEASAAFSKLGDYSDAADMVKECAYQTAKSLMDEGNLEEASAAFSKLGEYSDAADMVKECAYQTANSLMEEGNLADAATAFSELGDYSDSAEMMKECHYRLATQKMEEKDYSKAADEFADIEGYKDASDLVKECYYLNAEQKAESGDYKEAAKLFSKASDYKDAAELAQKYSVALDPEETNQKIIEIFKERDVDINIVKEDEFYNVSHSSGVEIGALSYNQILDGEPITEEPYDHVVYMMPLKVTSENAKTDLKVFIIMSAAVVVATNEGTSLEDAFNLVKKKTVEILKNRNEITSFTFNGKNYDMECLLVTDSDALLMISAYMDAKDYSEKKDD